MGIKFFVKAAISEYLDTKTNTMKKKYQSIGVVVETKHGLMLKIETLPLFALKDGSILAYLNEPEDKPRDGIVSRDVTLGNMPDDPPF